MNITVIGTGYVGLVTGTCFAEKGNQVTCVDIDEAKVTALRKGEIPIYEPGLSELVKSNAADGRLHFTTELAESLKEAEIIFLALPTPPAEDGSADLSAVLAVAEQLGKQLDHYAVIVNKSTVPVGSADKVRERVAANAKVEFDVVSNPEFLREGHAVKDFMEPDRVVVGSGNEKATGPMRRLYEPFLRSSEQLLLMDTRSAEMAKYAANSFLATKVTFINEIANLSDKLGANVEHVAKAIGMDERIGRRFLQAGIGYGGSCFPKDVLALQTTSQAAGYDFKILKAVLDANAAQFKQLTDRVVEHFNGSLEGKHIALWGLAFKPDTDDIREAPALKIIDELLAKGATITAYDPEAETHVKDRYKDTPAMQLADDKYKALEDADALVIATEWADFRQADLETVKTALARAVVFDGRNLFDPETMQNAGFDYTSIGRPS